MMGKLIKEVGIIEGFHKNFYRYIQIEDMIFWGGIKYGEWNWPEYRLK